MTEIIVLKFVRVLVGQQPPPFIKDVLHKPLMNEIPNVCPALMVWLATIATSLVGWIKKFFEYEMYRKLKN